MIDLGIFHEAMTKAGLALGERVEGTSWPQRVQVYYQELKDYPEEVVEASFRGFSLKEGARYFPSLGDMLAKCKASSIVSSNKVKDMFEQEPLEERLWRAAYHVRYSPDDLVPSLKKVLLENWEMAKKWFPDEMHDGVIKRLNARIDDWGY